MPGCEVAPDLSAFFGILAKVWYGMLPYLDPSLELLNALCALPDESMLGERSV